MGNLEAAEAVMKDIEGNRYVGIDPIGVDAIKRIFRAYHNVPKPEQEMRLEAGATVMTNGAVRKIMEVVTCCKHSGEQREEVLVVDSKGKYWLPWVTQITITKPAVPEAGDSIVLHNGTPAFISEVSPEDHCRRYRIKTIGGSTINLDRDGFVVTAKASHQQEG